MRKFRISFQHALFKVELVKILVGVLYNTDLT